MNRLSIVLGLLALSYEVLAINPSRTYTTTPGAFNLNYEEMVVNTGDGAAINVWHLPSSGLNIPIIISESDAGNMGDWTYLGMYLQAYGLDVWMYDYRGFGSSSDYELEHQYLYYSEFVNDLSAVVEFVESVTHKCPVLMGLSMGTIIIQEYLSKTKHPISTVIYDGYVHNPSVWVDRLIQRGKNVLLPKGYEQPKVNKTVNSLYIVAKNDDYSFESDIPKGRPNKNRIVMFESPHLSSFSLFPKEYSKAIQMFVVEHER